MAEYTFLTVRVDYGIIDLRIYKVISTLPKFIGGLSLPQYIDRTVCFGSKAGHLGMSQIREQILRILYRELRNSKPR